jgi:hypothetical protein
MGMKYMFEEKKWSENQLTEEDLINGAVHHRSAQKFEFAGVPDRV